MRNKFGVAAFLAGLTGIAVTGLAAIAAPPPVWSVSIAGRPMDAQGEYALYRNGVVSVNLVDFARALGGVIIYRTPAGAEIAINNKHLVFTTGLKTARLDDIPFLLPSAPFSRGDRYYVPLRTLALTAGFQVHFDRAHAQIMLGLPTISVVPTPLNSQIVLAAAGSGASDGLHLTATAANLTAAPLEISFPTSARVSFVASRDGRVLWNSVSTTRALQTKSSVMFTGNGAKSFAGFWPGFLSAGPGPIIIRAELLSTPPVFAPTFTVAGVAVPTPSPTPTGMAIAHPNATSAPTPSPTSTPSATGSPIPTPAASAAKHHHLL